MAPTEQGETNLLHVTSVSSSVLATAKRHLAAAQEKLRETLGDKVDSAAEACSSLLTASTVIAAIQTRSMAPFRRSERS